MLIIPHRFLGTWVWRAVIIIVIIGIAAAIIPLLACLPKKNSKLMPHVDAYVIFLRKITVQKKKIRVGIECARIYNMANQKSDWPHPVTIHRSGHPSSLWAINFSRLAIEKTHLPSWFFLAIYSGWPQSGTQPKVGVSGSFHLERCKSQTLITKKAILDFGQFMSHAMIGSLFNDSSII